YSLDIT
ncbi:hypothetical protein MK372_02630, partial [Streptococcus oralis]|nr:hypothetical protein [Streptococcus oralis]